MFVYTISTRIRDPNAPLEPFKTAVILKIVSKAHCAQKPVN